jgi:hypothetical protein
MMNATLNDKYLAYATYDQVIEDFWHIRPFINIRETQSRHIKTLNRLFERSLERRPERAQQQSEGFAAAGARGISTEIKPPQTNISGESIYEKGRSGISKCIDTYGNDCCAGNCWSVDR